VESLLLIFLLHFIGDFILQPYRMKIDKSRIPFVMATHIFIYSLVLFVGIWFFYGIKVAFYYSVINGFIHFMIDSISSKVISNTSKDLKVEPGTSPLYERVNMYYPIIFLGIDQLLHQLSLIITWFYIFKDIT